jgi:hypothetical protein
MVGLVFGDYGTEMRHLLLGTFVAAVGSESPMQGYGTWETVVMRCIPGGRAACSCYIFFKKRKNSDVVIVVSNQIASRSSI